MQILSIVNVNQNYELALHNSSNSKYITGQDSVKNMHSSIKELLCNTRPDVIHIITGPGSFTSLRIAIITARTLGIVYNTSVKGCSIFDCVKGRIILATGTNLYLMFDQVESLKEEDDIDFSVPFMSNVCALECKAGFSPLPNLINSMHEYFAHNGTSNLDPYYPIKPKFLV